MRSPQLADGEQAFVLMGLIPNRKGQPMLVDWQARARAGASGVPRSRAFEAFARAQASRPAAPEPGNGVQLEPLQAALPCSRRSACSGTWLRSRRCSPPR